MKCVQDERTFDVCVVFVWRRRRCHTVISTVGNVFKAAVVLVQLDTVQLVVFESIPYKVGIPVCLMKSNSTQAEISPPYIEKHTGSRPFHMTSSVTHSCQENKEIGFMTS